MSFGSKRMIAVNSPFEFRPVFPTDNSAYFCNINFILLVFDDDQHERVINTRIRAYK